MIRKVLQKAILIIPLTLALTACVPERNDSPGTDGDAPHGEAYQAQGNEAIQGDAARSDAADAVGVIPPMPVDDAPNWLAPDDLYNPDGLPVLEGPLAYRLQTPTRMLQLEPLTPGEELAILHTNMGDITIRFFPEEAPIAVTNFKALARKGHYDGLIFHRVIPGFMIQGGCPLGTGGGGESVWGGNFGSERSFNLRHFRGALAMAHAGPGTIGSQFYIVQNNDLDSGFVSRFADYKAHLYETIGILPDGTHIYLKDWHPIEALDYFIQNGGTPHLDWFWSVNPQTRQPSPAHAHPIFAHVVDGMDVVDAIANTPQGAGNRPIDDMVIQRISFIIYGE